jgi:hypothetical protein
VTADRAGRAALAAPGPQLGAGRLRVDAARAIAKLREYQLAIRPAWVLEAIRAAVASGATRISLTGDTNDLWLLWDGEPWPAADLPRLFDELVGPEASDARYHVRLLATAVNSALGMDPAYVDVYAIAATGRAVRARYTPEVLAEPTGELGDAPLRQLAVEQAAPPPGAGTGMAVHLRRRFGITVLSHLVRELPELELARAACGDLAVPLALRGVPHGGGAAARDLVRVPLGEGVGGFLAIVDPDDAPLHATLEVAEHGVVLATRGLDLGLPAADRPVPLRVFVDGPRMPTNASRSEVRPDVHPLSTVLRRVRGLLPAAAERLAAEVTAGAAPERARAAALALVAAAGGLLEAPRLGLGRLLELPLVRNAVGVPRPLGAGWLGPVHTGSAPYPEELAPWLGEVMWIPPGDPAACLVDLEAIDARAVKRLARAAHRERREQRRFYAHAPRPPVALVREPARIRARLGATAAESSVDPAGFEGLTGEVCIRAAGEGGDGELVVLLEGRELERLTYGSPIPFAVVIDAPRLRPVDGYRGAARDGELARVEAAMRAGVLCAIEAIAAGATGEGFIHGEPAPDADRRLVLDGLALALELSRGSAAGPRPAGPLFDAPLWPLAGDGGRASTAELRRHAVVGVTAPGARLRPLPRRPIVEVEARDRPLVEALLPRTARIVDYDPDLVAPGPLYGIDLAQGLLEEAGFALPVRADGCAAAIAPAGVPHVVISHLGRRVEERPYRPALVPCAIWVDSDDVVPDAGWLEAIDDGGVARHFAGWEEELLRAAATALAGGRHPDVLDLAPVEPSGPLGRALWSALATRDPDELLGEALAAQLRARPLFRVLGEREPVSAQDLAARFPQEIPFLEAAPEAGEAGPTATARPARPLEGFAPLVADPVLAGAIGKLAGRALRDAAADLAQRRRAAEREAKLAALRERPALPLELPDGAIFVRRKAPAMAAVIGVGRGPAMTFELRVEGRPVATLTRPGELPVVAIFEVPLDRLDEELALPPLLEEQVLRAVRGAVPELLATIGKATPAALADLGPARTLLAAALDVLYFDVPSRKALVAAEAFPTVQGPRVSLERAAHDGAIATASWDGEWLGPDDGEPPSELDRPVLHVPEGAGELAGVIARLHRHAVVDHTEAVGKLQAQRRIARGLMPRPAVHGVAPELKCRLEELGPAAAALGPGEIGLVDEPGSTTLLHVHGELRQRVSLDVRPPVHLAIEAPELVLERDRAALLVRPAAEQAALALLRRVLAAVPVLPVWLRHRLRRAMLAGRGGDELAGVPLFETAGGAWIDRAAVTRQVELFGEVWCLARPVDDPRPLDERRVVVMLSDDEQRLADQRGIPCVDAARELKLDARARANRARPRPDRLALDPAISTLATVTLDGDGQTAPRGVVAVLAPDAAHHRGVHAHRELYPFDPVGDQCLWPTRAIVDHAGLAPDRMWARPARDEAWDALIAAIREASEHVLHDLSRPPPRVLASQVVSFSTQQRLAALRGDTTTQLRGVLWLDGPPDAVGRIDVVHSGGTAAYVAPQATSMRGTLYVTGAYHDPRIAEAIEELCATVHVRLLAKLATRPAPSDLAVAHVAYGLAIGRLEAADAGAIRLGCFRPRPIDAQEWQALCQSRQWVPLVAPDAEVDELSVTDDGSATAKVALGVLGERAYYPLAPIPATPPERFAALRDVPRARPPHPLDPLVAVLEVKLRLLGVPPPRLAILEEAVAPMLGHVDDTLALAGHHPQLLAIAAAIAARSAWSAAAADALVAHAVTVLNVALTSVTDATEAHALAGLLRGA